MIIQFARIFNSSVYRHDPNWIGVIKQMESWDDDKCLGRLDTILDNSGFICLTPAVCKEYENLMTTKDVEGFFTLFDALRYPVFSVSLMSGMLQDVVFLEELIKQLPSKQLQRPKTTMAVLRDRWMNLIAKQLESDVIMGDSVKYGIIKPINETMKNQLLNDLKGMVLVLGAEDMFRWIIETKRNKTFGVEVKYESEVHSVAYNRLRLFVLNSLPDLVDLDSLKIDGQHLSYTLYLLCAYVHLEPTNTTRMELLLDEVLSYLGSNSAPTFVNDEAEELLCQAAKAYSLCKHQSSDEILSLIDRRRVNTEGWRVEFHHIVRVDDDIDTDIITWPEHYMQREQQEVMAFRLAWHLLGENNQFANDTDKEDYYANLSKRMFSRLKEIDSKYFRLDSYGYFSLIALAYQ